MILMGVPRGFPCLAAAAHSLRAATEKKIDRIRVEQPGCVCEFAVADLWRVLRQHGKIDSLVHAGTSRGIEALGGVFERRIPNWPGAAVQRRLAER